MLYVLQRYKKSFAFQYKRKAFSVVASNLYIYCWFNNFLICVKALQIEKATQKLDSLSIYLFLFCIFFLSRSTSPINYLLFVMADFRIHVVDEVCVVCFAKYEGESICHLH